MWITFVIERREWEGKGGREDGREGGKKEGKTTTVKPPVYVVLLGIILFSHVRNIESDFSQATSSLDDLKDKLSFTSPASFMKYMGFLESMCVLWNIFKYIAEEDLKQDIQLELD